MARASVASMDGWDTRQPFLKLLRHFFQELVHLAAGQVVGAIGGAVLEQLVHLGGTLADLGQGPNVGRLEGADMPT